MTVIEISELGKRYYIGGEDTRQDTFAGMLWASLRAPYDNLRRLRNMARGKAVDDQTIWALRDINVNVAQGDVLGVIGHNGSGKSTLLKILARITAPTTGEVKTKGRVSALLEVGTGFHHELSGRENVYLNGTILGMRRVEIDRKLEEIVDFSGVAQFIDTPVKFYSSGMKVRLGFAVAAHLEPDILLIDEVLAVGDADFQKKCIAKMEQSSRVDGRTIVFVSHHLGIMPQFCTSGIWLKNGRIAGSGDMQQIIQKYLSEITSTTQFDTLVESLEAYQDNDKIVLTCRYQSDFELDFPYFGFVLYDYKGQPVYASNPTIEGLDKKIGPLHTRRGTVQVTINYPKLIDGYYRVSIWFGDAQGNFVESSHAINLYITGMTPKKQLPPNIGGPVIPECDWAFLPEDL